MTFLPLVFFFLLLPLPISSQSSCPASPISIQTQYTWTADVDPNFPATPNLTIQIGFTPLLCVTHLANVTLWTPAQSVTPPIATLMRTSNISRLEATLRRLQRQRQVLDIALYNTTSLPEDSVTLSLQIESPFSKLSCIARILPSPGWFIGLSAVELCEQSRDPQSAIIMFSLHGWNSGIFLNQVYRGELLRAMKPPGPVTMLTGFASRYAQATVLPSGASVTIPTDIEPTVEPALGGANDDQNGDGDTTNENDNVCFPIGESVILESGSRVPVEQLELGSVVMSRGAGSFSRVFVFSHRDRDVWSTFVRLQFEGPHGRGRIRLSPRHYIYRMRDGCGAVSCSEDSVMVMAQDVQAGDLLVGMHGSPMSVIGLDFVQARGLYNPHTLDGDLVVSGVRVSVYTASVEPQIASALLAPVRGVFQLGWRGMSVWLSESVLYGAWNGWLCKLISL